MDAISITSHLSTSKDNKTDSDSDLSIVYTEDKKHPDLRCLDPCWEEEISTHDRVLWEMSMCVWQTSIPLYYNET